MVLGTASTLPQERGPSPARLASRLRCWTWLSMSLVKARAFKPGMVYATNLSPPPHPSSRTLSRGVGMDYFGDSTQRVSGQTQ